MQREPSLQSLSYMQYFAPFTRSLGTLTLTSPEFISMAVQAPFRQLTPGLQSVSNTQARAGIEVRQRTLTMTRPRIVVPREEPLKSHRGMFKFGPQQVFDESAKVRELGWIV
jgi:hypothetical protein